MLKMFANGERADGKPMRLVVFGLSHKNLDELRKGRPITFDGSTVRLDDDIQFMIFAGKDEQTMQREFGQFVGPNTDVRIDPKLSE